jgi:hypothetical protein
MRQGNNGSVRAIVVRSSKQGPFRGATVKLVTDVGKPAVAETKTDDKGSYTLSAKPGKYLIFADIKAIEPACYTTNQFGDRGTKTGQVGGVTLVSGRIEKYDFEFNCQ